MRKLFERFRYGFNVLLSEIGMWWWLNGTTINTIVWILLILMLLNGGCHFSINITSTPNVDKVG